MATLQQRFQGISSKSNIHMANSLRYQKAGELIIERTERLGLYHQPVWDVRVIDSAGLANCTS